MKPFLFISDLDNTLVGDDRALETLNQHLDSHRQEYGTKIVYATGRSLYLYKELTTEKTLLPPDALITSVGTEIYFQPDRDILDKEWANRLDLGWSRDTVLATSAHFSDLVLQPDSEQNAFKVSYYLADRIAEELIPKFESALAEKGLNVKLIYSASKDLDVIPKNADKGLAVQYLREKWQVKPEETVVCGDSGNDIALFTRQERGIIVGNAKSELSQWYQDNQTDYRYLARSHCAGGILEGLKYFKFL
ncbi:MAG: sucrose-phosphate phosphatase [Prochloraceae cyanobacterium]